MIRLGRLRRAVRVLTSPAEAGSGEEAEPTVTNPDPAPLFDKGEFDDLRNVLGLSAREASVVERRLHEILSPALEDGAGVKVAMLDAARFLMTELPDANFAVLWHVVLREAYKKAYTATCKRDGLLTTEPIERARQSWASHSGRAFERLISRHSTESLPAGLRAVRLDNHERLRSEIEEGIGVEDGLDQKFDIGLLGKYDDQWYAFGALHCKTTLRERLNDDDMASQTMMENGLFSAVVCVSSSPNQSVDSPTPSEFNQAYSGKSNQRKTIEDEGRFHAAFCLNAETRPTPSTADTEGLVRTADIRETPNTLTASIKQAWEERLASNEEALIPVTEPYHR